MDELVIKGPAKLKGEVAISSAKNACLPLMSAILLFDKPVTLKNAPALRDIYTMTELLKSLGVKVEEQTEGGARNLTFDASHLASHEATYELVKTMRASIFVLGPLLARLGKAKVSLPGGCAIGTRPIDLHLSNLEKMGAFLSVTREK